jgi:hypothetical protein
MKWNEKGITERLKPRERCIIRKWENMKEMMRFSLNPGEGRYSKVIGEQ